MGCKYTILPIECCIKRIEGNCDCGNEIWDIHIEGTFVHVRKAFSRNSKNLAKIIPIYEVYYFRKGALHKHRWPKNLAFIFESGIVTRPPRQQWS